MIKDSSLIRDNTKEVVIDKSSGLMWKDDITVKTIQVTWKEAMEGRTKCNFAGYNDWRLPSINELKTIADRAQEYCIKKEFKNIANGNYWTHTPVFFFSSYVKGIKSSNGLVYDCNKDGKNFIRYVRVG
jgi:hypothetical protein